MSKSRIARTVSPAPARRSSTPLGPLLFAALGATACGQTSVSIREQGVAADPRGERVETVAFETTEGSRPALDLTPDGRFIITDLLGQLWRIPIAGGEAVALTDAVRDTAEDIDPAVSPDGKWIAFESDRPPPGGRGLWVMAASGGGLRKLSSRPVPYFAYLAPAWSPDSRRITYTLGDSVYIVDVATASEKALRVDSLPAAPPRAGFTPRNSSPAWSPDGRLIAFVNTAAGSVRGDGRIWEVGADGGVARPVTTIRGVAPAFSPDGSQLAFFSRDSSNRWQVFVQSGGGVARQLTNHVEAVTLRLRWTPDGQAIVYAADGGLWRVPANGGAPSRIPFRARISFARKRAALTPALFAEPGESRIAKGFTSIALARDGRRIAMIALDTVWIGDIGGPLRALVATRDAGDNTLTWSPSGEEIAWTRRQHLGQPLDLVVANVATGSVRVAAAIGRDIDRALWSPDGRWIAVLTAGQLRLVDPTGVVKNVDQARLLGPTGAGWGVFAWSPRSDGLVSAAMDLDAERERAQWIPLTGERKAITQFPRGPANLVFNEDGTATWVENDRLWRAPLDPSSGLRGTPSPLSDDAAVEARSAADGSVLYLSVDGLRLRSPRGDVTRLGWPLRYRSRAAATRLLIRGARVIDGKGSPLSEPRDVLLDGGHIARIAPMNSIADASARIVDATGAYLTPGFIELHGHIWDDLSLLMWLHNGVTTVRDIASQKLKTADTRNAIDAGLQDGPRVVYGGAMFHRGEAGFSSVSDQMVSDSGAIARGVAIQAGMDARFVKERGFDRWWSAVRLVSEAHRHGLVVSGHCEHVLPVIAAGVDGAEHVQECFRDRWTVRDDYASLTGKARMFVVPTMSLYFSFVRAVDDPALVSAPDVAPFLSAAYRPLYVSDSAARLRRASNATVLDRAERSVARYYQAGVVLATGTDSPFPLGVHHDMEALVAAGLTPMEAIVAATGGAARVLNAPQIGTIAEGRLADLVLLDKNPLDDIRNARAIRDVIQGGRVVDRARLRAAGLP